MAGFWMVPVVWDYHIIYKSYSFMLYNPITSFIIDIRKVVLYNETPEMSGLLTALGISLLFAVTGYFFMRHSSKKALEFL
jgi:ABC-type polysaccharide/polyol phosphate export permease